MTCSILKNEKGEAVGFMCGSAWGMGITYFPDWSDEEKEEFGDCVYGFAHGGDPHDFAPDYECNTAAEIKAWEDAKASCQCGR